jgi:hypothetical protein
MLRVKRHWNTLNSTNSLCGGIGVSKGCNRGFKNKLKHYPAQFYNITIFTLCPLAFASIVLVCFPLFACSRVQEAFCQANMNLGLRPVAKVRRGGIPLSPPWWKGNCHMPCKHEFEGMLLTNGVRCVVPSWLNVHTWWSSATLCRPVQQPWCTYTHQHATELRLTASPCAYTHQHAIQVVQGHKQMEGAGVRICRTIGTGAIGAWY